MFPLNHRPLRASAVVYLHKIAFFFAPAVTQITSDILFHIFNLPKPVFIRRKAKFGPIITTNTKISNFAG